MVKLTKIYTRKGDDGKTLLGNNKRVSKHSVRVAAYGTLDEANSFLGLARANIHQNQENSALDDELTRIQHDLFDLGADLCMPAANGSTKGSDLRIAKTQVERLENEIDSLNQQMASLSSFVLPGGTPAAAHLHVARTIVRRAERLIFELNSKETVNPIATAYLNRLSDYLFVAARFMNRKGKADVLWRPGQNQQI